MALHAKVVSAYSEREFNSEIFEALRIIQVSNKVEYLKYSTAVVRPGDNEIFYSALIVYTEKGNVS